VEEAGMVAPVPVTRLDLTAADLREAAKRTHASDVARRMLALALVLEGKSRSEAAKVCGMDRQILCDWVHRYNAEGLQGLHNRTAPGAKPRLSPEQEREVADLVRNGPTLAEHGVVRWRRIDLARVIEQRYAVKLAERSVGAMLRRMGFRRLSVRPRCPEQDTAALDAHKKLPQPGRGSDPSACAGQADRALVAGRGPRRPAGHLDPCLGRARQPAARAARSTL
jgi:transposase